MNSVENFQNILNKSNANRYKKWTRYRALLTNYIISKIKSNQISKTIILGAGNSDDIDLKKIENYTEFLMLADIDLEAMKKAISKYKLDKNMCTIIKIDFLGLDDSKYWNNFVQEIIKLSTKAEIEIFLNKIREEILSFNFLPDKKFDLVIVTPIYTQLFLNQSLVFLDILNNLNYKVDLINFLKTEFLKISSIVINKFNENVINLMDKSSHLIVVSDIFEADYNSDFYRNISSLDEMDQVLLEYQKKYGIGLGDYGLINLDQYLVSQSSKWLEWPFNKNKCFFVKVNEYKK
ncbi:hypothetical protein ACAG96_07735 [Candidatus Izemoplasma sp. B36]|uniref:hypothetical protein n=1 Tax=Candidatus Izemoplasma sp. B36 TaxID=3242468 RepID=UPI003556640A